MLTFKQFITEAPKGFEGSKFDDDKGVKEGTPADKKRDAKEIPKFLAAKKNESLDEHVKWDYTRGDNYNKNVKGFHIINHRTGAKVGMAKTLNGARRSVDLHDNKYGAYAHTAHPVYHDTIGESAEFTDDVIDEESNSAIAKKAHKGENVGHGGFGKVEKAAEKEYGSKKAGERVAAAVMWRKYGHKK